MTQSGVPGPGNFEGALPAIPWKHVFPERCRAIATLIKRLLAMGALTGYRGLTATRVDAMPQSRILDLGLHIHDNDAIWGYQFWRTRGGNVERNRLRAELAAHLDDCR